MAWSSSTSFSNVVPGPGDLLVRLSMYRTWGFGVDQSMISMTTSGIFQNVNRLSLPIIGVIWFSVEQADSGGDVNGWLIFLAALGLAILAAGFVFGVMVIRSEKFARKVGGWIERLVNWAATKFKRDAPDDVVGTLIERRDIGIAEIAYVLFLDYFATGGDAVTGAIAAGVTIFRIFNWLLVVPVGFTATAVWRSTWKKRLGFDPFTILTRPEDTVTAG